jgi:hypothetical protein
MSIMVIFFFAYTTTSVLVSGYLLQRYMPTLCGRRFGIGLIFTGVAFAIWSFAVAIKPVDTLYTWMTAGMLPLFVALVAFFLAGTSHHSRWAQQRAVAIGIAWCAFLLVLRYFYPSSPHFSENGLFYFGQHPYVKFVTISLLCAAVIPATLALAREIRQYTNLLSHDLFIGICVAELVGSVLLLANTEDDLLFFVAWTMGFGFLLLLLLSAGFFGKSSSTIAVDRGGSS